MADLLDPELGVDKVLVGDISASERAASGSATNCLTDILRLFNLLRPFFARENFRFASASKEILLSLEDAHPPLNDLKSDPNA